MNRIFPYRWRLLTIWIVVFTLLTAYALYAQSRDRREVEQRFCDVTASFISGEIQLRDQLNKADLQTIGARQRVVETARNATLVFTVVPRSRILTEPLRQTIIDFFDSIDELNVAQIAIAAEALAHTDTFVERLDHLKKSLKC